MLQRQGCCVEWIDIHRQDRIKNECIRKKVKIESIVETMVESHLRWFRLI